MLIINGEILHYTMFNYPHVTVVAMITYNEYASSEIWSIVILLVRTKWKKIHLPGTCAFTQYLSKQT